LALPHDLDVPALSSQRGYDTSIAGDIPRELCAPVANVRVRDSATPLAAMLVPKAPVNEDDLAALGEDEVRHAGEILDVQAVTEAGFVEAAS